MSDSVSGVAAYLAPYQEMANLFTNGITISQKKGQLRAAPVIPNPRERARCADLPIREGDNMDWNDSVRRIRKDSPHHVSAQAGFLYMARFIFAAIS